MSLFKKFGTDKAAEVGGKWFYINVPNADNTLPGFLLARRSSLNIEFVAAVNRAQRDQAEAIKNDTLDLEKDRAKAIAIFVDTVLKGWQNIFDDTDASAVPTPIAYSRANAIALFTELPDLMITLTDLATQMRNYQDDEIKGAAKNLQRPSSPAKQAATGVQSANKPSDAA